MFKTIGLIPAKHKFTRQRKGYCFCRNYIRTPPANRLSIRDLLPQWSDVGDSDTGLADRETSTVSVVLLIHTFYTDLPCNKKLCAASARLQ